jgi:hypothetical protein
MTKDTTPEAVERVRRMVQSALVYGDFEEIDRVPLEQADAMIAALSAALEAEKARADKLQSLYDVALPVYEARLPTAEAKLKEAVQLLRYMVNHAEWREENEGVFWEATEQSRAFLASIGDKT